MPRKKSQTLTPDEERFVEEYLIDRNGTAAYLRVKPGTLRTTAGELASRLLKKVRVKAAVASGSRELNKRARVSAAKEVRGMALLANYDIGAAFDMTQGDWVPLPPRLIPYEIRLAIVGVKVRRTKIPGLHGSSKHCPECGKEVEFVAPVVETVEYKFADKVAARDKLMRHLGLYQELPPLEKLIDAIHEHHPDYPGIDFRETVRQALAAALQVVGTQSGGDSGE